jgi:hypothetical protein
MCFSEFWLDFKTSSFMPGSDTSYLLYEPIMFSKHKFSLLSSLCSWQGKQTVPMQIIKNQLYDSSVNVKNLKQRWNFIVACEDLQISTVPVEESILLQKGRYTGESPYMTVWILKCLK